MRFVEKEGEVGISPAPNRRPRRGFSAAGFLKEEIL